MRSFSTPNTRWIAVTGRDPAASNEFIYCVTSTNIYCRPTCPARLPRRQNVVFHDTAAAAAAAGYRACMRCRPSSVHHEENDSQRLAVSRVIGLIQKEGNGKRWSVKDLAREVCLTESHFCRVFKKITGKTIGEYRKAHGNRTIKTAKELVPSNPEPILWQATDAASSHQVPVAGNLEQFMHFDLGFTQEWYECSGAMPELCSDLSMFLEDAEGQPEFNFSPEAISDASTPSTMDNGFQFINFEAVDLSTEK